MPIPLPFSKSYAFIIGINKYKHLTNLSTAIRDAKELKRKLEEDLHGYEVHTLIQDEEDQPKVAGKVQLERFLEKMDQIVAEKESRVIIYYAGHGYALNNDENHGGYLVPSDAVAGDVNGLVSMEKLRIAIDKLSKKCKHGLLVLDCCYSGAFRWSTGYKDAVFDLPNVLYEDRYRSYVTEPAWQVITSSAENEKAMDSANMEQNLFDQWVSFDDDSFGHYKNHSPFASAFFNGIDGAADIMPKKGDGVIIGTELYTFLRESVEKFTRKFGKGQTPGLFTLPQHGNGQYVFFHDKHPDNLPSNPSKNPFLGLKPYTWANEDESANFFGRKKETEELYEKLTEKQVLFLQGDSGCGKSSLVNAALLPILKAKGFDFYTMDGRRTNAFNIYTLTEIEKVLNDNSSKKCFLFLDHYQRLIHYFRNGSNTSQDATYKVEDDLQQELELKVFRLYEAFPKRFFAIFCFPSTQNPLLTHEKLIALYEDEPQDHRYFLHDLLLNSAELRKENESAVRNIVLRPVLQVNMFFDDDGDSDKQDTRTILDAITGELCTSNLGLPLLSLAMQKIYDGVKDSDKRILGIQHYHAVGGLVGCLAQEAEAFYDTLKDEKELLSLRRLLLRMVNFKADENKFELQELHSDFLSFKNPEENERVQDLLKKMVEARIIVHSKNEKTGILYYKLSHPGLLEKWRKLKIWIRSDKERLLLMQALREQVRKFEQKLQGDLQFQSDISKLGTRIPSKREIIYFFQHENESEKSPGNMLKIAHRGLKKVAFHTDAYEFLWNHHPDLPLFDARRIKSPNFFTQKESYFIESSVKLKNGRKRIWEFLKLSASSLLLLFLIGFIFKFIEADKNFQESEEKGEQIERLAQKYEDQRDRYKFERDRARKTLMKNHYLEYSRQIKKATNYVNINRPSYGCPEFEKVFDYITDPNKHEGGFITDTDDTLTVKDLVQTLKPFINDCPESTKSKINSY